MQLMSDYIHIDIHIDRQEGYVYKKTSMFLLNFN